MTVAGCSETPEARAPNGYAPGPYASGPLPPLVPMPPPSPAAALATMASSAARKIVDAPCPPPGLPPEVTARLDCAAMKHFASAALWVPREVAAGSLPQSIDLRAYGLVGPVKDQQQVGACAGFAMSTVMDNAARRAGRRDVIAPMHVYAIYAPTGGFSEELKNHAITVDPVWPYSPPDACRFAKDPSDDCGYAYGVAPGSATNDPRLRWEKDRADHAGALRITGYEEMPADASQLALVLASGEALYAALDFNTAVWNDLRGYDRMPYYPAGTEAIGHAIAFEGYRSTPQGREFLIHNSWGTDWGRGGYAWMHESMIPTHVRMAYRVTVVDAAIPAPPAEIACAAGSTSFLGVCVPNGGVPGLAWPSAVPGSLTSALPAGTSLDPRAMCQAFPGLPCTWP